MSKSKIEDSRQFPNINSWLAAMNASEAINAGMIDSRQATEYVKKKIKDSKNA